MAVEVISAVDRNRDVLERRRIERATSDRVQAARERTENLRADAAQQKLTEDTRIERERTEKLQADDAAERVRLQSEVERKRLLDLELEREFRRVEARRQDELDELERRDAREAAGARANLEAERVRVAGIEAYRAQIEQLTALRDRFALEGVQAATGNNVRAQIAQFVTQRIDQVDLSAVALARLQGVVGLQGGAGSQLTGLG